ncbi:processed acidic surface protein [Peribacillus sp. SCS-155]|uniref:processed acidic surface protein n=1 Tax=Peribacillus sedimenti TaxID=3115297 RepID=UPI003905E95A
MRKLGVFLISLTLLIGLFPGFIMAAEPSSFDKELDSYLQKVSQTRGFDVTREDIEASLAAYDESLSDYHSIRDLKDVLGEVIKKDLSNLDLITEDFGLDQKGIEKLLIDNGEQLSDYVFLYDLYDAIELYRFERDPNFDQDLSNFISKISKIRGLNITKKNIEDYLASFDDSLDTFETVDDLSDYLGEVIKSDLSNLDQFNEYYGLDRQAIEDILKEHNKDLSDYIFIDQLDEAIWEYTDGNLPGLDEELAADMLPIFEQEFGLSEDELNRIEKHLESLEGTLSDEQTMERLDQLAERMMRFEEFDSASDLSAQDIAEISSIYDEFLSIFKLKASFSLVKNDKETAISFADLIFLEELKGAKLKVSLYTTDGEFLADLLVSEALVDSETLTETGEQMEEAAQEAEQVFSQPAGPRISQKHSELKQGTQQKTVKGAKLPKTATNYISNAILGALIALAGFFVFRHVRKA